MGVFIYLSISKTVNQAAWEPVYREALTLAQQLGLAEYREQEIGGVPIWCLSVTEERTTYYGFEETTTWTGFDIDGDYATMETGEKNGFPKEIKGAVNCSEPVDAMLETYLAANEDKNPHEVYSLLGGKTQGYAHHIPLLAVCCLIVDRLADQAYVYGDITAGQCRNAVKLANKHLDRPIALPDYCDPKRMALRLKRLSLSAEQAFDVIDWAYLGKKDSTLGTELRQTYGAEACYLVWEKHFQINLAGSTNAFKQLMTDYLNMGFELEHVCQYYTTLIGDDKDDKRALIQAILETGLCDENRNRASVGVVIDPDREEPYGIDLIFAQLFRRETYTYICSYMPPDECRAILTRCLGCPDVIDDCFASWREKMVTTPSKVEMPEPSKVYDIIDARDLLSYHAGKQIEPVFLETLKRYFSFFTHVAEEEMCEKLEQKGAASCYRFLASNCQVVLRDRDWERIWETLQKHPDSFRRYYPAARVEISNTATSNVVHGIVLNDELYELLQTDGDRR